MNLSPRLSRIFHILLDLENGQSISADDLAARIRVSRRTLFRELESARLVLDACGMTLAARPGLHLQGNDEKLRAMLAREEAGALDREERQDMLLYELLRSEGAQKLIVYASKFQVSEATISHDLEDLRKRLEAYGLKLEKNGVITGEEEDRRRVMSMLVREGVEYKTIDYLDPQTVLEQIFKGSAILSLLDQDILRRVLDLFARSREQLGLTRYEQNSYIGLVIHLVIALERIQAGDPATEPMEGLPEMEEVRKEAWQLAGLLEEEFQVEFPPAEVDAIALHLLGAKMNEAGGLSEEQSEVLDLARTFIEGFDAADAALLSTDAQFIQGLVCHLEPTVIRLRSHLPIYNPLLDTLRSQYGDLFSKTRKAAASMEKQLGLPLSDEEIGFLTMHVGACFERHGQHSRRKVQAAVVCASGIGVSALLGARLEKAFDGLLDLENLSVEQARSRDDVELFITTFKAIELPGPTVQVSPMLRAEDLQRIREKAVQMQAAPSRPKAAAISLENDLHKLEEGIQAARSLAAGVPIVSSCACSPRDLIHEVSRHFKGDTAQIESDLWRREQLGSVIAPEEAFGIFHARSEGTSSIQAAVLLPESGTFENGLQVILVTLLPEIHTRAMQDLLSDLNRTLAQEEEFRKALIHGSDEERQSAIRQVLVQYVHNLMESFPF